MKLEEIQLNIFKSVYDKDVKEKISLSELFAKIKSDKYNKEKIDCLRNSNLNYDKNKKLLNAVCFNSTFDNKIDEEHINSFTNLILVEFDEKENHKSANEIIESLKTCNHTLACWKSVGGKGVHSIFYSKIDSKESYKIAFNSISDYLKKQYDLKSDSKANVSTQLSFISYDEGIYINYKCEAFKCPEIALPNYETNKCNVDLNIKFKSNIELDEKYRNKLKNYYKKFYIVDSKNDYMVHDNFLEYNPIKNSDLYLERYVNRKYISKQNIVNDFKNMAYLPDNPLSVIKILIYPKMKIYNGKRKVTIKNLLIKLCFFISKMEFKDLTIDDIYSMGRILNEKCCSKNNSEILEPISNEELTNIVEWVYSIYQTNEYNIPTEKSKILITDSFFSDFNENEPKNINIEKHKVFNSEMMKLINQSKNSISVKQILQYLNKNELTKENTKSRNAFAKYISMNYGLSQRTAINQLIRLENEKRTSVPTLYFPYSVGTSIPNVVSIILKIENAVRFMGTNCKQIDVIRFTKLPKRIVKKYLLEVKTNIINNTPSPSDSAQVQIANKKPTLKQKPMKKEELSNLEKIKLVYSKLEKEQLMDINPKKDKVKIDDTIEKLPLTYLIEIKYL